MTRTYIDIDNQACAEAMWRYQLAIKPEAINFALRTLAAEPESFDQARALRGIGWEGDFAEILIGASAHRFCVTTPTLTCWPATRSYGFMKLSVDKEADALYLRLADSSIVESE